MTGVALLVLGAGNAILGYSKLAQYQGIVAEGRARGYFPDAGSRPRILRPLDEEGERYNIGRAKVDLYRVVTNGGLVLVGLGTLLTLGAWIRLRLQGAERAGAGGDSLSARTASLPGTSAAESAGHASATR